LDQDTFAAVDAFVERTLVAHDGALQAALETAAAAGLPQIQVSPPQGTLLQMLARLVGAHDVLEFGTLGGYSAILLARVLPDGGRLTTLEANPEYADVARGSIERAGLAEVVEVRVGPALETLPALEAEAVGPFDLVFIDADKVNTPHYFAWALDRTRSGGADHCRQCRPRRHPCRNRQRRPHDQSPASPAPDARRRAPSDRHHDPNRRQQGL
jgi:predicted O-methyltransferase YrrM